jgi:hypothetical protein
MLTSAALHIGKTGKRAESDDGAGCRIGVGIIWKDQGGLAPDQAVKGGTGGSQKGFGINPARFPPTLTFGRARST